MTLKEEIALGESRTLEFKKELPTHAHKWLKTVVAFANGAGGQIIVGVENNRKINGISPSTDLFELRDGISDAIDQACSPQIIFEVNIESIDNAQIILIKIFPGNATPYYIKSLGKENGTFVRLGATTRQADSTIIDELYYRGKHIFYDELPNQQFKPSEKDIDYLCKDFSERAERKISIKDLENFHLLIGSNKNTATNALAILLGQLSFSSRIQCARFKGTERVNFLDKKEFEGPLCEQIDGAYNFVLSHMNSSVQVAVYDDRLEISSPGGMYGTLTLEEALQGRSSLRNQTLARTLEKIGVIEGWGSGFKRIFDLCDSYNVSYPEIIEIGDLLRVNFYRPSYKSSDKVAINAKSSDKVAVKAKEIILDYLNKNQTIDNITAQKETGLSASGVRKVFVQLVEENQILAHGTNKGRTYSLYKDKDKNM